MVCVSIGLFIWISKSRYLFLVLKNVIFCLFPNEQLRIKVEVLDGASPKKQ